LEGSNLVKDIRVTISSQWLEYRLDHQMITVTFSVGVKVTFLYRPTILLSSDYKGNVSGNKAAGVKNA
jgi:hypothetical protein